MSNKSNPGVSWKHGHQIQMGGLKKQLLLAKSLAEHALNQKREELQKYTGLRDSLKK